jgi:methylphosphotriester-DNA--protein-cysteine methyltransferase
MTGAATQWYSPVPIQAELADRLACAWTAIPSGVHRLTPDGCLDLLRVSDGSFLLCGPERRSWRFRLPNGVSAVGVRFRPGVAGALLGFDVSGIVDCRVPVADIVGRARAEAASDRIAATAGLVNQRDVLVEEVRDWIEGARPDPQAEAVLDQLIAHPGMSGRELAAAVGLSVRTLHRLATRRFGYGIATLARIVRLQRLLALVDSAPGVALAVLAAEAGYSDQAHLSSDCRAITGLTPTAFVAEWFPTFPDMADPYKTHASVAATMAS